MKAHRCRAVPARPLDWPARLCRIESGKKNCLDAGLPTYPSRTNDTDKLTNSDRKFKLSTKTADGVSFTTEGTLKSKGFDGKLTSKFKLDQVSVDKLSISTAGRLVAELSASKLVDGAKFSIKAEEGAGKSPEGKVCADYSTGNVSVNGHIDVVNGPTIYAASTVGNGNFTFGAEAKYNTKFDGKGQSSVEDYNVLGAYSASDMTVSLQTSKCAQNVHLGVHHQVKQRHGSRCQARRGG